jgi:hypothetical protein
VLNHGDLFDGGNCEGVCCLGLETYVGIYQQSNKINILREVPLLNTLVYTTCKANRCLGTGQDIEGFTPVSGKTPAINILLETVLIYATFYPL